MIKINTLGGLFGFSDSGKKTTSHWVARMVLLCLLLFTSKQELKAQTCSVGSATSSTGYGYTATGGSAHAQNAIGAILASGSILSASNSAILMEGTPLVIDMQRLVSAGSVFTVSYASLSTSATATASIEYSLNGTAWTSLGSALSTSSATSVQSTYTVPSGGLRYVRITRTSTTNLFIDGVQSTHYCFQAVKASFAVRAFYAPGTNKGSLSSNVFPANAQALAYSVISSPSNGTFSLNASSGAYTYTPNTSYDGIETVIYKVCDGGADGNLSTSGDNNCDQDTLVLRAIFNCDTNVFFVPIPENEAIDYLKDISGFSGGNTNNDPQNVYMGLSVTSDAIVIYDHWEDGFETNPRNPTQSTTQIWGDGDLKNGVAPGFPNDLLSPGNTSILMNPLFSGHNNLNTYDPNASGSDDSLKNVIDYDGKDKILIHGVGAMSKFSWGTQATLSMSGAAVPRTEFWGNNYTLPVGMNTAGGGIQFEITSLSIMAEKNSTTVNIDRDANGSTDITVTLNQGESYYLDSRTSSTVTVNQGATISANNPIQVMLMTGPYNNSSKFQGRTFALTPNSQLSTCYYMPGVPSETVRVYLYNPGSSAITVTRTTAGGATSTISVPAGSSAFDDVNNSGDGYQYCSGSTSFAMIATVDYNSTTSDWGFVPIPQSNLQQILVMSVGVGSDPTNASYGTNNYEQLMVTPTTGTYFYVDLDGDGSPDKFSINDDIDVADNAVTVGSVNYDETTSDNGVFVSAYRTLTIGGTNGSLNGAIVWTKTASGNAGNYGGSFAAVWGQNGGPGGSPNVDAGYTIPPKMFPPLNYTIQVRFPEVCPGSVTDSILINIIGGVAPYRIQWINLSTGVGTVYNFNSSSANIPGITPGTYIIKIRDANCLNFTRQVTIVQKTIGCQVTLSGNVYNDGNALTDNTVNTVGSGTLPGTTLYANLLNTAGTSVVATTTVSSGAYNFSSVNTNQTYIVQLSTNQGIVGSAPPSTALPANWINTGENLGAGTGSDGTVNGLLSVTVVTTNITNANFGIEKRPDSDDKTAASQVNPGGTVAVAVPALTGSDNEDGTMGAGKTVVIKSLPANATLYYNSLAVTLNQVITSYTVALLTVDPNFNGAGTVVFTYAFRDAALQEDLTPATVTMPFTGLVISGTVFHDRNGLVDNNVNGPGQGVFSGVQIKAYLINSANSIIEVNNAAANGTYSFSAVDANSSYRVLISSQVLTTGSTAPSASTLPANYIHVGENFGTANNAGSGIVGGTPDGFITVAVVLTNVTNVDFGVEYGTFAHDKTYNISPNDVVPGTGMARFSHYLLLKASSGTNDTTAVTGLPGKLSGFDLEDGRYGGNSGSNSIRTVIFNALPDTNNALVIYAPSGTDILLWPNPTPSMPSYTYWNTTLAKYVIPTFNSNNLKLYLKMNYQSSTAFMYSYLDAANVAGRIATYAISYTSPLPVNDVKLTAQLQNRMGIITWTPKYNAGFAEWQLYRRHESTPQFMQVYRTPETGNSSYTFLDNLQTEPNGKYYYQLRATGETGANNTLGTVSLMLTANGSQSAVLIPNPAGKQTTLSLSGYSSTENTTVDINDVAGKNAGHYVFSGNELLINTSTMKPGIYLVSINRDNTNTQLKLVIQ